MDRTRLIKAFEQAWRRVTRGPRSRADVGSFVVGSNSLESETNCRIGGAKTQMMTDIVSLAAGKCVEGCTGQIREAFNTLIASAFRTARRFESCFETADTAFVEDFGPVIGRRFAEEVTALLYGRLDPVRLIVAMRGSQSSDFTAGLPNPSSWSWSDNVMPSFDQTQTGPWAQDTLKKNKGIVRGLLSGHLARCVFEDGFLPTLDVLEKHAGKGVVPDWMVSLQKFSEGEHLLSDMRRRMSESYSHLSKGIHFEFMPQGGSTIESKEIRRLLYEIAYASCTISMVTNFSGFAHGALPSKQAFEIYKSAAEAASKRVV